ncbi:MAG TPA: C4-dicarboxylate ABC transporter substrate-binding protein, partial [Xanthobacteraceae bacterium]|nr:C4-dicarboxylate ABC transporter substrate-binding protein [Xanthobacteraceae bacterium]
MTVRILAAAAIGTVVMATAAPAQEAKHYRFAYDQPRNTGYGVVGDVFA